MEYCKIYYETSPYGSGTWTEETSQTKIRIIDSLLKPMFAEITVADPNHTIQDASTYGSYQRILVKEKDTEEVCFLGRVEFIESTNDDALGPALVLQCHDMLQELEERVIDHDFSGIHATCGALIEAIIIYYTYTEISYDTLAGGAFTVGNWISTGSGSARIVYDDTGNDVLALTDVDDFGGSFINNATLTEYSDVDLTTATGVTALQDGALVRNIDPTSIPASVAIDTSQGDFSTSSLTVLKAIEAISVQQAGYDYHLDFGSSPGYFPPVFQWYARGSLLSGDPATNGLTLEYNPSSPGDQTKAYLGNYRFPVPEREQLSQVIVKGMDDNHSTITGEYIAGANAYANKIHKVRRTQRSDIRDQTDLTSLAQHLSDKTNSSVQRGNIQIEGFPYYTITGTDYIVRAGQEVYIKNSRMSSVDQTNMLVQQIVFEEPPGISTINSMSTDYGLLEPEYTYPVQRAANIELAETRIETNLPLVLLPLAIDIDFTAVDWDTASWSAGTITASSGESWSTDAGSLNMANSNPYYLYFEVGNATLQTTQTFGDAVGDDQALIAFILRSSSATENCTIVPGTRSNLPVIAADAIFANELSAITANMGLLNAGEIRVGTGTLGSNFTGWRLWVDTGVGRIAGYNSDTLQWYTDTDGKLYAGGGGVIIDTSGITVSGQTIFFKNSGGTQRGLIYGGTNYFNIYSGQNIYLDSGDTVITNVPIEPSSNGGTAIGQADAYFSYVYGQRIISDTLMKIPVGANMYI